MKTLSVLGLSVLAAAILSSPVFADDDSSGVVEWVKDNRVAIQGVAAGALFKMKANQVAILEKASPEFAKANHAANEAAEYARAANSHVEDYRTSVSLLYERPSSAMWDHYNKLQRDASYWRKEAHARSIVANDLAKATVEKMKKMPDKTLYKKYVGAGVWNKIVRPVGIGALVTGAVVSFRALSQSEDLPLGEQARANSKIDPKLVANGTLKPASASEAKGTIRVATNEDQMEANAAK
jgi:hypothetical protein